VAARLALPTLPPTSGSKAIKVQWAQSVEGAFEDALY
jgi:hypothetical protein